MTARNIRYKRRRRKQVLKVRLNIKKSIITILNLEYKPNNSTGFFNIHVHIPSEKVIYNSNLEPQGISEMMKKLENLNL